MLSYTLTKLEMSNNEFVNQPLWGNHLFANKNNCLYFKEWINSNGLTWKKMYTQRLKQMREIS